MSMNDNNSLNRPRLPIPFLLSTALVAFGSVCIVAPAMAEDKVLSVTVAKKGETEDQIAFAPFSGDLALSKVIVDNLRNTSLKVTTQGLIGEPHSSQELQGNLPAWQQLGYPYLVVGNASGNTVTFEVIDLNTGRNLSTINDPGRRIHQITASTPKQAAIDAAARIYEIITKKKSDINAKIVYIEERGSGKGKTSALVMRDSDGSNPKKLTEVTNASIFSPAASPDGRYLAYSVQFENNNAKLYRYDLYNNSIKQLVNLKGSNISPAYSPDGSSILFSSTADGDADIYRVSSSGGTATKLFDLPYEQGSPSYAPDGSSFYFYSDHASPNRPSIYRYSFSGSPIRVSRGGYATNPNVSPDGTMIGYLNGSQTSVMDTSGNNLYSFGSTGLDQAPSFSPSSERVVYSQGKGNSTIVIRPLSGDQVIIRKANGTVKSAIWVPSSK